MADDEAEEVYSIEKIVKKKITKDGKIKYFLKWKDYPDSDNTWEMAEDLDCKDLIEKFEEELAKNGDPVMEDSESEEEEDEEDEVSEPPEEQIEADQASAGQDDPLDEPITTDDPLGEDEGGVASSLSPSEQPMSEENSQPITEETSPPPSPSPATTIKRPASGFDKGYSVETIIGITPRKTGKYAFLIKWKESTEPTLEEREVCNTKCPQKIIRFYEKRLVWMKG